MNLEVDSWYRFSSEVLQFYATDEDVGHWLRESLPSNLGPYYLVGADNVRVAEGNYVWKPYVYTIEQFPDCRKRGGEPWLDRLKFFIHSVALSGEPRFHDGQNVDAICSINGLIDVTFGWWVRRAHENRRILVDSFIGIVNVVANEKTGQIVVNKEYHELYRAFTKAVKRDLTHTTILLDRYGNEAQEVKDVRMTDRAVLAYQNGVPYNSKPGRRLKGKKGSVRD